MTFEQLLEAECLSTSFKVDTMEQVRSQAALLEFRFLDCNPDFASLIQRARQIRLFQILASVLLVLRAAGLALHMQLNTHVRESDQVKFISLDFFPCSGFSLTKDLQYIGKKLSFVLFFDAISTFDFVIQESYLANPEAEEQVVAQRIRFSATRNNSDLCSTRVLEMFLFGLRHYVNCSARVEKCLLEHFRHKEFTESEVSLLCDCLLKNPTMSLHEASVWTIQHGDSLDSHKRNKASINTDTTSSTPKPG